MMQLGLIMLPFAVIAFVVAIAAIAMASILPKRRAKRIAPDGQVKIIFMDSNGQPEPQAAPRVESQPPAPAEPEVITVAELRTPEQASAIMQSALNDKVEHVEIESAEETQSMVEGAPRRGLGSFLRFGISRKRDDEAMVVAPSTEVACDASAREDEVVDVVTPLRRKLFSAGKSKRVVKAAESQPSTATESDHDPQPVANIIASVTTQDGTTSVDARGVIHEQPAEAEFPVERFAENDRMQDVAYASEAERVAAEHRMEMERMQAEQQAYDAEQRRALELKEAKHRRAMEILEARARLRNEAMQVEAKAAASVQAHLAQWWIRLDPDVQDPQESERIRLAGSLEAVRAPWAAKLICTALEQDESERVRARLLGAYARGYRTNPAPLETALTRTQIERWAIVESLTPFAEEAQWIADIVSRAKGEAAAPALGNPELSETPNTQISEANIIQLPSPATPPAPPIMDTEAAVAAAS